MAVREAHLVRSKNRRNKEILLKNDHELFLKMRHIYRELRYPCKKSLDEDAEGCGIVV